MVIFKKKRRMIDIREMQKRGIIRMPPTPQQENVPTDPEGFVDFSHNDITTPQTPQPSQPQSTPNFFGFMDSSTPQVSNETASSSDDLRKISSQLSELDNKLYKIEQRIEVLERKSGVGY